GPAVSCPRQVQFGFDTGKNRPASARRRWGACFREGSRHRPHSVVLTDDAIVLPPGLPAISGKAELREYVESSWKIPGFRITWTSTDVTFSPDGNLAYMLGRNEVAMDDPDGMPVTMKGRGITIWRRDPDGEMRCVVDIW